MRTSLKIEPSACFLLAVLILILPLKWLAAALLAAVFHELCHILAIKLTGGQVYGIRICAGGTVMEMSPLSPKGELLCALAGPFGSLLLLCFCHFIPRIALCALVQGLFNLLPVFPLDGGRVLKCAAELLLPGKWAGKICGITEGLVLVCLILLSVLGCLRLHWGAFVPVVPILMLIKAWKRKIPCKEANIRVQ